MNKLLPLALVSLFLFSSCAGGGGNNNDATAALQKQIDEIKNLPSVKKEIEQKVASDNQEPFNAIIVSNDAGIGAKIDQIKQNIFKKMQYTVVTSDSEKGKELITKFGSKYLPLMVVGDQIKQTEIKDFLSQLAVEKDGQFNVDVASIASQMRIDIEKSYLITPDPTEFDGVKGPKDAKVVMIEFSDFQCPYCKKYYSEAHKKVIEKYGDKIQLRFKQLPLSFHDKAQKAAESALCALKQGKFWEMHDKMFDNQETLSIENYKKWAKEIGIDSTNFDKCLDSGETTAGVKTLSDQAANFGIQGTPGVFINDKFINGAYPFETFDKLISDALAK